MNDLTDEQKQALADRQAAEASHNKALQDKLAVDENDPRVAPHLAAGTQTVFDPEEQKRRADAVAEALARTDQSAAKVQAALDALHQAEEALAQARQEHGANLETYAQLEPVPAPTPAHLLSPGEATTPMFFPKPVQINSGAAVVAFPAGIHPVPESLTTHWWMLANGVRPYTGSFPEPEPQPEGEAGGVPRTRPVGEQRATG